MASVQAEQRVRDIETSRMRGETRADSARYLAEGMTELDRSIAGVEDTIAIMKNYLVGGLAQALGTIIGLLSPIDYKKKPPEGLPAEVSPAEWFHQQWNAWQTEERQRANGRPPRLV